MPTFKNLSDLFNFAQQKINDSLKDEVSTAVIKTEKQHIESDVYNAYSPSMYERRDGDGGLMAEKNIVAKVIENTLEVENVTPVNPIKKSDGSYYNNAFPSSYGLDDIVEYGYGGLMGTKFKGRIPSRPFVHNTIKELLSTKLHVRALKTGLRNKGIRTE